MRKKIWLWVVPLLFLLMGILTLKDYGINWDEPYHFMRGQAYLYFFMTGKKDYLSLPKYPRLSSQCPDWAKGNCSVSPGGATDILSSPQKGPIYEDAVNALFPKGLFKLWRSSYQHDVYDFNSIMAVEGGHPPLNDIMAAFTNYVFYQRLHIMGDIESHHLFEILSSFLIVAGVGIITYFNFGLFSALVASFSLSIYPLFFSESHFNIKDPPDAAFFGLTIILFYFGIIKKNWKFIFASSIFAGLALGTKLNIVFAPFVVAPWLMYFLIRGYIKYKKILLTKKVFVALIFFIPIALGLVYAFWPYLWKDPLGSVMEVLRYYKQIGIGTPVEMTSYLVTRWKWNTYPLIWIIYTTQIPILVLSISGILYSIYLILFKKKDFPLLVLFWLLVPIIRISWPNAGSYGGVRHIMEFVPPLAITVGIGAAFILKVKRLKIILGTLIVTSLLFATYEMVKIHPNENVYFNQIVGGLPGARAKNIPYWGNTYGNVYQQGADWLNKNAEPNARLGFPIATQANLSRNKLRTDIDFANSSWSGTNRSGEYEMEMDLEWPLKYVYSFQYYDVYLNPVYVVSVEGVPLLKVWKNDLEHTKPEFKNEINYIPKRILIRRNVTNKEIYVDMGKEIYFTRISIQHATKGCTPQAPIGYLVLSEDNKIWKREPDPIYTPQVPVTATGWTDSNFVYLSAGKKARYIIIDPQMENSCLLSNPVVRIQGLKVLP
ncbi:MAG: glycosyltransferase family 39 protein [Candidatus Woesebacteria bacterium]|nr:glycosyltransferase family 39 protein [Candidatus Woesebacteria bacterium]